MPQFSPIQVRDALSIYFDIQELKDLCFELDIRYEDLGGTGISGKAAELVQYAQRRSLYDDLVARVQALRPHAGLGGPSATASAASGQSQPPAAQRVTHIHVTGDYVSGGKVAGDQVDGDKIDVDSIAGSGIAIGDGATANTGDTFNLSGDFRGANVNVKSTLKDVHQTIGDMTKADDAAKTELQQLIFQLNEALQKVPADKAEDADAVAQITESLVETANDEKPNKMMLQITGEGLKQAAQNLAAIVPDVVKIAGAIVAGILGLG